MYQTDLLDNNEDQDRRLQAFAVARRHSSRVRWLRRGIIIAAFAGVLIFFFLIIYSAFFKKNLEVSASSIGINGSKITVTDPNLAGFRKDGRAYRFNAVSGLQDLKNPGVLELQQVVAVFDAGGGQLTVTSPSGVYNSKTDIMDLNGPVSMHSTTGYDLHLNSAKISFKSGELETREPADLIMRTGTVSSENMNVFEGGQHITFDGNVRSRFFPSATEAETKQSLKGTLP